MNWQPIETAPKDGTWVLLKGGHEYSNDPVGPCVVAFWNEDDWSEPGWSYCYWDSSWRSAYEDPTHWCAITP